jgi:hypothetical protein
MCGSAAVVWRAHDTSCLLLVQAWWRLPQLTHDAEYNCQLAAAVLQPGDSRQQGWARLAQALAHGLAAPVAHAAAAAAAAGSTCSR